MVDSLQVLGMIGQCQTTRPSVLQWQGIGDFHGLAGSALGWVVKDQAASDKVGEFVGCSHGTNGTRLFGCLDCALVWHNQQADKASSTLAHHENWIMALRAEIRERDKNKTVAFPIEDERGEDDVRD